MSGAGTLTFVTDLRQTLETADGLLWCTYTLALHDSNEPPISTRCLRSFFGYETPIY